MIDHTTKNTVSLNNRIRPEDKVSFMQWLLVFWYRQSRAKCVSMSFASFSKIIVILILKTSVKWDWKVQFYKNNCKTHRDGPSLWLLVLGILIHGPINSMTFKLRPAKTILKQWWRTLHDWSKVMSISTESWQNLKHLVCYVSDRSANT